MGDKNQQNNRLDKYRQLENKLLDQLLKIKDKWADVSKQAQEILDLSQRTIEYEEAKEYRRQQQEQCCNKENHEIEKLKERIQKLEGRVGAQVKQSVATSKKNPGVKHD